MVWAGIGTNHWTEPVFIEGSITVQVYHDSILAAHVPFFRAHRHLNVFQQDNARPHVTRINSDFLGRQRFAVMVWPAVSPDVSPIEHFWDELGVRNCKRDLRNVRELQKVLRAENGYSSTIHCNVDRANA